jgi:hypothetical protein
MNRAIVVPWLLLGLVAVLLIYVLVDKSVTIDYQSTELSRSNDQAKALRLLIEKEFVGSTFDRVKGALVVAQQVKDGTNQVLEKNGNLHFYEMVFEFQAGKLVSISDINKFESKK